MQNSFSFNVNNLIKKHLYFSKAVIITFSVLILLTTVTISLSAIPFEMLDYLKKPFLGDFETEIKTERSDGGMGAHGTGGLGFAKLVGIGLTSPLMLLVIMIFNIILVNIFIVKEKREGTMINWVSLPISKKELIMSKIFFFIVANTIAYGPSMLYGLAFSAAAVDAKSAFLGVFLNYAEFILLTYLFTISCVLISYSLDSSFAIFSIISAIVLVSLVTWFIGLLAELMPENFGSLKFFNYLGLQILTPNNSRSSTKMLEDVIVAQYPGENDGTTITYSYTLNVMKDQPTFYPPVAILASIAGAVGVTFGNIINFKKIDLYL